MAKAETIPRYDLFIESGTGDLDPNGNWMLAVDVEKVFPYDVAFMPVPRCERCQHWYRGDEYKSETGMRILPEPSCQLLGVETEPDFGCVKFKAKDTDPAP